MDASITIRLIDETRAGFNRIQNQLNDLDRTAGKVTTSLRSLQSAAIGFISAIGIREVGQFVTGIQNMDNRLRLVVGTTEDVNRSFDALFKVAQETRTPIQANVDLFSKLGQNLDILGKTQEDLTDIIKAFNLSLTISGSTGQAASAAILQFAQAMQSGRLNGDEFRTMLEQNPKFLQILSKYTGIAREDLKKFASDGLLNSKVMAQALQDALPELAQEHDRLSRTVGGALTMMINEYTKLAREFLNTSGTAELLVEAIDHLATKSSSVIVVLEALGVAIIALTAIARPWLAIFTAVSTAFIYFAEDVAPFFRQSLDFLYGLIRDTIGVFGALYDAVKAMINLEDPFEAFHKSVSDYAKESRLANVEIKEFNTKVQDTKKVTEDAVIPSEKMKNILNETGVTAAKAKTAYDDYIKSLKESIIIAGLDEAAKVKQNNITKALEAAAKDLGVTVAQLSEERRNQIIAEVSALTDLVIKEEEAAKDRKRILDEQKASFEKYDKFIEENQVRNQTRLQEYLANEEKIRKDFSEGLIRDEEQMNEALKVLKDNFQKNSLKDLSDYIAEQQSAEEKYRIASAELTEIYHAGLIEGEAQFQTMLLALKNKYGKEWADKAKEYRDAERSETEKYNEDLTRLQEALNAGLIANAEDAAAIRAGIEKEYRDSLITEYNSLYGYLGKKLEELTGVTKEQLGITRDIFKLVFGVDINDILKQAFAEFIKYIIGFRTAGEGEINGFTGIFKKIFGSGGEATQQVQIFSNEGTGILDSMVKGVGGIFGGLIDIFKEVFSGGLGIIGEFATSAIGMLKNIGGGISNWFSGLFKGGGGGGGGFFDTIMNFGSDIFGGVTDFLGDIPIISDIMDFGGNLLGDLGNLLGFSGGGGGGFNIPGIGDLLGGAADFLGFGEVFGGASSALSGLSSFLGPVGIGVGVLSLLGEDLFGPDYDEIRKDTQKSLGKVQTAIFTDYSFSSVPGKPGHQGVYRKEDWNRRGTFVKDPLTGRERMFEPSPVRVVNVNALNQYAKEQNWAKIGVLPGQNMEYYLASGMTQFGAKGLAFDSGSVQAYAMGGIIDRPTVFGTNTGLAIGGEAGTEAILPLERTADGRLGVSAVGGDININFNINAVDSAGIDRLLTEKRQYITNMVRAAVYEKGRSLI